MTLVTMQHVLEGAYLIKAASKTHPPVSTGSCEENMVVGFAIRTVSVRENAELHVSGACVSMGVWELSAELAQQLSM